MFNRGEIREHTRRMLRAEKRMPAALEKMPARDLPLFIGPPMDALWRPPGVPGEAPVMVITQTELRGVCGQLARSQIEIMEHAEFTVGVGEDGQAVGATFCWWEA